MVKIWILREKKYKEVLNVIHGTYYWEMKTVTGGKKNHEKKKERLSGRESNPGRPRDRRKYSPLYYRRPPVLQFIIQQFASWLGCHSSREVVCSCGQFVHSAVGLLVDSALTVEQIDHRWVELLTTNLQIAVHKKLLHLHLVTEEAACLAFPVPSVTVNFVEWWERKTLNQIHVWNLLMRN